MVEALKRSISPEKSFLPLMYLDDELVANRHSPLSDALKAGQGQGRISTFRGLCDLVAADWMR
jgi:hypothetical protein